MEQEEAIEEIQKMMEAENKKDEVVMEPKKEGVVTEQKKDEVKENSQAVTCAICPREIVSEVKDLILKMQRKTIWHKLITCATYVVFGIMALVAILIL